MNTHAVNAPSTTRGEKHRCHTAFGPLLLACVVLIARSGLRPTLRWVCALLPMLTMAPMVQAGPSGGSIVGGAGSIQQSGLNTTIQQTTASLAIDWQSFNINNNERVQFIQPSRQAIALNRVLGNHASEIHGQVDANGQLILVNPNGIFFSPTAVINVGGLIASGLDLAPSDFMNGEYLFSAVPGTEGAVVSSGMINAALGGSVTLLGQQVNNQGFISAHLGAVNLAAGKAAVLTFDDTGLMGVKITQAVLQDELGIDPAVLNSGEIKAHGGRILLTGSVSQDVFSQAVNTGPLQQATSVVVHEDGSFTLGAGADVVNSGVLDVSSQAQARVPHSAGDIVVLGEKVTSSGGIHADAAEGQAGHIELHAADTTELMANSRTTARSQANGRGGLIKVLGTNVGVLEQSTVDASGAQGGGTLLIGGDREGLNPDIPNAEFVFVAQATRLLADALETGAGGKLITFANDTARIYGGLFARGGVNGGQGGFIETSGLQGFEILEAPDVSAPQGPGGLWLIDPYDITIGNAGVASSYDETGTTVYTSNTDSATIAVATIENALGNGNVEIKTGASGTQPGNISFDADLNYNGTGSHSLTLDAANNIVFTLNKEIYDSNTSSASADTLNLKLYAGGAVTFNDGVSINTQGGDFTVGLVDTNNPSNNIIPTSFDNSGAVTTAGLENSSGGAIVITTSGDLTAGALTSNGGAANNDNGQAAGNITLTAGGNLVASDIFAQGSDGERDGFAGKDGGAGGVVTLSAGGLASLAFINTSGGAGDDSGSVLDANGGDAGGITISGTGITLNANITAVGGTGDGGTQGNGAAVTFNAPVTLAAADIDIDTSGNSNGNISFNNGILASSDRGQNLTLTGNDIALLGAVANETTRLGNLVITASGALDATGSDVFANRFALLESTSATVSNINTVGANGSNGGIVAISSSGAINTAGITTTAGAALAGNNGLAGGNISLAGSTITVGELVSTGSNGNGAGKKGGDGGTISLSASDNKITLNGNINAQAGRDTHGTTGLALSTTSGTDQSAELALSGTEAGEVRINYTGDFSSMVNITGNSALDTLYGANRSNAWRMTGANAGSLNNNMTFSSIEKLVGGSGNDTLTGINQSNTWVITAANSGTVSGLTDSFEGFENLIGGASVDEFILHDSIIFNGSIDGGGDTDSLTGGNRDNTWQITGSNSGTVTGLSAGFANIETLQGNAQQDSFNLSDTDDFAGSIDGGSGTLNQIVAGNRRNTWTIIGADSGTVTGIDNGTDNGFANINNLLGHDQSDDFIIASDGSLSGTIDGGSTDTSKQNSLENQNTTNTWALTGEDQGLASNTGGFANIQTLIGSGTSDTLTGANQTNTWTATGDYEGTLDSLGDRFIGMEQLQGNDGVDLFYLGNRTFADSIAGGGGSDQLFAGSAGTDWVMTGNNQGTVTGLGVEFSEVENLRGSGNDTLNGADQSNTWTMTASDTGTVTGLDGEFSGMGTLVGNQGVDRFELADAVDFAGRIDGGGGVSDIVVGGNRANVWTLTANNQGTVTGLRDGFSNIEYLEGGSNTDTLTGSNQSNTWVITAADSGTVSGLDGDFSGMDALVGNQGVDRFELANAVTFAGRIDGGGGVSDVVVGGDRVNAWTLSASNQGTVTGVSGGFSNIEHLEGGSNTDTLSGNNVNNTWTVTGINTGTLTALTGQFSSMENLTGGTAVDTFNMQAGSAVTGLIDGGTGPIAINEADKIDVSALGAVTVELGATYIEGDGRVHIDNIESVTASAATAGTNTLIGDDVDSTWTIGASNTGTVTPSTGGSTLSTDFTNFSQLQGGSADDTFSFLSGSNFAGSIDAGADNLGLGGTGDIVDYSFLVGAIVDLNGSASNGVANAELLRGNNLNNILQGANQVNTWTVDTANSGRVVFNGETVAFEGFNTLRGGSTNDTFNVSLDTMTGTTAVTITADVASNSETDTLNLTGGNLATYNGSYVPGTAGDQAQFTYTDGAGGSHTVNYALFDAADTIQDNTFADRLTVNATAAADIIELNADSFTVNAATPVNYTPVKYANKNSLVVDGLGGADVIDIVSDVSFINQLILTAEEVTSSTGAFITASSLQLESVNAMGSVNSDGTVNRINTNVDNLFISNSGAAGIYLAEANALNIAQLNNATGPIDIVAGGSINDTAVLASAAELSLASGSDIVLNNDNQLSGLVSFSAAGGVTFTNTVDTNLGDINAQTLNLTSTGDLSDTGVITVVGQTNLNASDWDINLNSNNDFGGDVSVSANNVVLNDINSLSFANSGVGNSLTATAGSGIQFSSLNAGTSINLNAGGGGITGNVLAAPRLELRANSGIGTDADAINTQTSTLVAENRSGLVNLANTGVLTLEQLTNAGDIFLSNNTDIKFMPGSVDAGYNTGTLLMTSETGSFLGVGNPDTNNPDITAFAAVFIGFQGTFGTLQRPLVLNVQDSVLIQARSSLNPIFAPRRPRIVDDRSLLQLNAFDALSTLSGGQLIEVETLSEVDPAIFTDVRNYNMDQIAIRLPRDQLFEDELEEYGDAL